MNPHRIILTKIYLFVKKNFFLIIFEFLLISFFFALGFIKGSKLLSQTSFTICQDVIFSSSSNFEELTQTTNNTNSKGEKKYVASNRGKYYYPLDCYLANNLSEKNKVYFSSEKEAEAQGYLKNANCEY